MVNIQEANNVFNHLVTGGSEFCWQCWPNARYMDYESEYSYGSVVFNSKNQMIYEATVSFKDNNLGSPYRWLNPKTKKEMFNESDERKVDKIIAWDDIKWVDLELWEDFAEKASLMFRGEKPDTRILVPIDLPDNILVQLALESLNQDITINQLISNLLQKSIDEHEISNKTNSSVLDYTDDHIASDIEHSEYWHYYNRNR